MKIWIDFINTPQVSFFTEIVKELEKEGHHFLFTCRNSGNTVSLAQQQGWMVKIVGDKAEKGLVKKMTAFPSRVLQLRKIVKEFKPDVAVCQSSFYLPLTAFTLGIPSVYTNDNEHAMGNIPSFLFASKIFIPEYMPIEKVKRQGAALKKITRYPGVKEGIYLWRRGKLIHQKRKTGSLKKIYIRPEPTTAQYYKGKSDFLDNILLDLQQKYEFVILPRDKEQSRHYQEPVFSRITVCEHPMKFEDIAADCRLFIGAGGSMTREMAIIGVPSISVYQDELLGVDKFLVSEHLLIHEPNLDTDKLLKYLQNDISQRFNNVLLEKGKNANELIKNAILSYSV